MMMRFIGLPAALVLAGCAVLDAPVSVPPAPAQAADQTRIDEQAALAAELAYQAGALAAKTAIEAGWLAPAEASRVRLAEGRAYDALLGVRAAYRAGNASDYLAALSEARAAVAAMLAAVKGNR